jgi:hypothetical protein
MPLEAPVRPYKAMKGEGVLAPYTKDAAERLTERFRSISIYVPRREAGGQTRSQWATRSLQAGKPC